MFYDIFYLFLILFIVFLIFLIILYSGYQTKEIVNSINPNGLAIGINNTMSKITYTGGDLSFYPINEYRRKKISGKFILDLSSNADVEIQLTTSANGDLDTPTTFTIWNKESNGITRVALNFQINSRGTTAHNISVFAKYKNSGSSASVSLHNAIVFYNH